MKTSVYKFIYQTTILALSSLLFAPAIAKAQLQVTPLVIEARTDKGQSKGVINITNASQETIRARVYAQPFTFNRDGFEALESSPNDLTPYLTFSPRELVLQPGETRQVRVASRMLPSLAAGEYRAVIFTENLASIDLSNPSTNSNTTITAKNELVIRFGVSIYVRHGTTASNIAVQNAIYVPQRKEIKLLVSNSGNASARVMGNWQLKQGEKVVLQGTIANPFTVIAGGDRYLLLPNLNNSEKLAAGQYKLTGELTWLNNEKSQKLPFSVDLAVSSQK